MPKKVKYTGAKRYNEKQIERLLECSKGDALEIVILLAIFYGLRRSEVLGLKWSAVDMENDTIDIKHTVVSMSGKHFNLDSTKHDLRHSSAGYLKHPGFDLKDINVWLRHKDIQTTANLYLDLDMSAKSEIANTLESKLSRFAI